MIACRRLAENFEKLERASISTMLALAAGRILPAARASKKKLPLRLTSVNPMVDPYLSLAGCLSKLDHFVSALVR